MMFYFAIQQILINELQNNLEENENNDEKYNIKILNKH